MSRTPTSISDEIKRLSENAWRPGEFERLQKSHDDFVEQMIAFVPKDIAKTLIKEQWAEDEAALANEVWIPADFDAKEAQNYGMPKALIALFKKLAGKRFSELPKSSRKEEERSLKKGVRSVSFFIAELWSTTLYGALHRGDEYSTETYDKKPLRLGRYLLPAIEVPLWSREQGLLDWKSHITLCVASNLNSVRAERLFHAFAERAIAEIEQADGVLEMSLARDCRFFIKKDKKGYYLIAEKTI